MGAYKPITMGVPYLDPSLNKDLSNCDMYETVQSLDAE